MNDAISTKEFPVRFFKEFFIQEGIHIFIDECIEKWFVIKDRNPDNVEIINTGNDIVMRVWYSRMPGEEGYLDSYLSYLLVDLLKVEVKRSKDLMIEAITFYHETVKDFINIQLMIVKEVSAKEKSINKSTNVKTYLNGFNYSICEPYLNDLLELF
jgi:hypothetical protein